MAVKKPLSAQQMRAAKVGGALVVAALALFAWGLVPVWPHVLDALDADGSGKVEFAEALAHAWPLMLGLLAFCAGSITLTVSLVPKEYTLEEIVELEALVARARERRVAHETRMPKGRSKHEFLEGVAAGRTCAKCAEVLMQGLCPRCDEALSN